MPRLVKLSISLSLSNSSKKEGEGKRRDGEALGDRVVGPTDETVDIGPAYHDVHLDSDCFLH